MNYDSNLTEVVNDLVASVKVLLDPDPMLRTVASSMVPVLRKRVHEDGLDASGSPIGDYSPDYLKARQKAPFNRTSESKKVLSLTRQTENDMKALPIEGGWGIGYSNDANYQKVLDNEKREGKLILTKLTTEEEQMSSDIAEDYVNDILKQL